MSKSNNKLSKDLPLGTYLALLSKSYFGALIKKLERLEIERYYSILIVIENSRDGATQQDISDTLKIDKASMVRIIDFLAKKKIIERVQNLKDRREYKILLTAQAKKVMAEIHMAIEEVNDAATKGLTKTKVKEFNEALKTIFSNLNSLPAHKMVMNMKKVKK